MYAVLDCPDVEKTPTSIEIYENARDAYEAFVALVVEDLAATSDLSEDRLQARVREDYPSLDERYDCGESYIAITSTGVICANRRLEASFQWLLRQARAVVRPPIAAGQRLEFHATLQGADSAGVLVRNYSGQKVAVLSLAEAAEAQDDPECGEDLWQVRADDGVEFAAWASELNGFIAETLQTVWPKEAAGV
jgi:hypothetical protein